MPFDPSVPEFGVEDVAATRDPQDPARHRPRGHWAAIAEEQERLRTNQVAEVLRQSADKSPDAEAEVDNLSRLLGVPHDLVRRNLDEFKKQRAQQEPDLEDLQGRAPKLAAWLVENAERAAMLRDHVPAAIELENKLTFGATLLRGWDQTQAMWGRFLQQLGETGAPIAHALGLESLELGYRSAQTYGRDVAEFNEQQARELGAYTQWRDVKDVPSFLQWLKEGVGTNLPFMAATTAGSVAGGGLGVLAGSARVGSMIGAFLPTFTLSVGETRGTLAEKDPNATGDWSIWVGGSAIAALDSVLPTRVGARLVETFGWRTANEIAERALMQPVKPAFLRWTAKGTLQGMATEGITEAFQEAFGQVAASYAADQPVDWAQTWDAMKEAGLAGAAVGGLMEGGSVALAHQSQRARYDEAMQAQAFFDALAAAGQDVPLAQRSPEAYQELVAAMTKDGPVEKLYVPVEAFVEYWQGQNVSPAAVAERLTGSPTALQDAIDAGDVLAIPTAAYAAQVAATEHHAFFAKEVKLRPDALNAREATAVKEALEAQAQAISEAVEKAVAGEEAEGELTPIRQAIVSQLVADPRFQSLVAGKGLEAEGVARTYSAGVEQVFTTLAARIGGDPLDLFNRYGLRIGARGPKAAAAAVPGPTGTPAAGVAVAPQPEAAAGNLEAPGEVPSGTQVEPTAVGETTLGQAAPRASKLPTLTTAPAIVQNGRLRLSTRVPGAAKAQAAEEVLRTDLAAVQRALPMLGKLGEVLRHYPQLQREETHQEVHGEAAIELLITRMMDNLRWLWQTFPADLRDRAKLWYVGAHRIAGELAEEHGVSREQAAGVLACLSPQMDWFRNVSLAERLMGLYNRLERENPVFSEELFNHFAKRVRSGLPPWERKIVREKAGLTAKEVKTIRTAGESDAVFAEVAAHKGLDVETLKAKWAEANKAARAYRRAKMEAIRSDRRTYQGQVWSALPLDGQAKLLRAIDETTNSPHYPVILPEGERGGPVLDKQGRPGKVGWGTYVFIANAISVMRDGSVANINDRVGYEHKVRSFFNNISDPWDPNSVTIDTHAVAAALLEALSGNAKQVTLAMSGPASAMEGLSGANAIYAEAYFRLAAELGVLPRELQSVTWEAVRGLFSAAQKRQNLPATVRELWREHHGGKLSAEELRGRVLEASGGIQRPAWANSPARVALDEGQLRAGDVRAGDADLPARRGDPGAGARGPARGAAARPDGLVFGHPVLEVAQGPAAGPRPGAPGAARRARRLAAVRSRLGRFSPRSASDPYAGTGRRTSATERRLADTFAPTLPFAQAFSEIDYPTPTVLELEASPENAAHFRALISASKAASPQGVQVYVYDQADYQGMRLFVTEDERAGFALKADGDIVSVFSSGGGVVHAMLALAVQQGGTKLDCFDTVLPQLYAVNGFRVVSRDSWNDAFAPEGWDYAAFAEFNNGRPDVVYMQFDAATLEQGEQVFYQSAPQLTTQEWATSRLLKAVELSRLAKASGAQWKATIKGSKLGINQDEFLFVGVEDLEDTTVYSQREVADYIRTNQLRVETVAFGEAFAREDVKERADTIYERWLNEAIEKIEDEGRGAEFHEPWAQEEADGTWTPMVGNWEADHFQPTPIDNYETEAEALKAAAVVAERALAEDEERVRFEAAQSLDWDDARETAERELEEENEGRAAQYQDYIDFRQTAEPGSYREVLLTAPQFGATGFAALSHEDNRRLHAMHEAIVADLREVQARAFEVAASPAQTKEALDKRADTLIERFADAAQQAPPGRHRTQYEDAVGLLSKLREAGVYDYHAAGWVDGHSGYDGVKNPIVRLRFDTRQDAAGRRVLFLQEVQPPREEEFGKMPPLLQKNWREIAFKWALHYAVANSLEAVTWTTGQMQADRYDLSSQIDNVSWMPVQPNTDEYEVNGVRRVLVLRMPEGGRIDVDLDDNLKVLGATSSVEGGHVEGWTGQPIEAVVGKELAKQLLEQPSGMIRGTDLHVGGEGLKRLYDIDYRNVVNKLPAVKKSGGKVGELAIVSEIRTPPQPANGGRARLQTQTLTAPVPAIEITPEVKAAVVAGQVLFQGERGKLRMTADRQVNIELLADADLSTFLHETGHLYLEVLGDIVAELGLKDPASLTAGQQGVLRDYQTILKWLKVPDRAAIGVAQHEQWARGFEAYLREGKAPSPQLRGAFARYRAWLTSVYQTAAALDVQLSDEVRGVFDRLLAGDEAIAAAEKEAQLELLFATPEAAGMTPEQFELYRKTAMQASQQARDALAAKLLQEYRRERSKAYRARRKVLEAEVREQLLEQPVYRALHALQRGQWPDGTPLGADLKLSKPIILSRWGKDTLAKLPLPWVYSIEGGVDPDAVAELFGFSSGDEMVVSMVGTPKLEAEVNRQVREKLHAEFGDLREDGSLRELAKRAVQENGHEAVLSAELRAIQKLAKTVGPHVRRAVAETKTKEREKAASVIDPLKQEKKDAREAMWQALRDVRKFIPLEIITDTARQRIAKERLRDLNPNRYWIAARQAGERALEAAIKNDYATAAAEKQKQRLAVELYKEANRALERAGSIVKFARRFAEKGTRARLGKAGHTYLDQVDAIVEKFDFGPVSNANLEKRDTLVAWVAEQEAAGLPVDGILAERVEAARRQHYRNLTIEELGLVRETLGQIEHLARLKNRLLRNAKDREFFAVRDAVVAQILTRKKKDLPLEYRPRDKRRTLIQDWFASHAKIAMLARWFDQHADAGPLWSAIIRPLNEAADASRDRRVKDGKAFAELLEQHYPGRQLGELQRELYIPAIKASLSKEGRLAVALNWGNATSRERLLNDPVRKWSEPQVKAILDTLDRRDWQFVQAVWDFVDHYWQEIADKQKRVTGLAPEKVEALEVETPHGKFRGGYYPLAYDHRMSARAGQVQQAGEAKLSMQAAYVRTTTRRGHVETRLQHVGLPVRLELSVMFEHLDRVIHDLTHHEVLIDVTRLLRDKEVSGAMLEAAGEPVYRQFTNALAAIASNGRPGGESSVLDRAASWMKTGTQVASLGLNLWTSLQQPFGVFNGMQRVGVKWVMRGLVHWLRDAATMENTSAWINERSAMMRNRAATATQDLNDLHRSLSQPGGWFDNLVRTATKDKLSTQTIVSSFLWHIGLAQKVADIPTWLGAYEKAMASSKSEDEAVALADQAVLDSQGGGEIKDLSAVQRGGPVARLFMVFYSYGATVYNATADAAGQVKAKSPLSIARFLGDLSLIYVMPAVGVVLLGRLMGKGGDDDDAAELVEDIALESLSAALNTMVLVRELGGLLREGGATRGWSGPSGARFMQLVYNAAAQVEQGEADAALWKSLNSIAGILFRYPSTQVQKTVDGWVALQEGRTSNPFALLVGPPPKGK